MRRIPLEAADTDNLQDLVEVSADLVYDSPHDQDDGFLKRNFSFMTDDGVEVSHCASELSSATSSPQAVTRLTPAAGARVSDCVIQCGNSHLNSAKLAMELSGNRKVDLEPKSTKVPKSVTMRIHPIFVVCFLCLVWAIINTFAPPPIGINTGVSGQECSTPDFDQSLAACICPRKTVCAKNNMSIMFLVFSRASAYFDYPLYVILFVSKSRNLQYVLDDSYLREFVRFDKLHHLHAVAGCIVSVEVVWHSFWHLLRWGLADEIHFLWTTTTGVSGTLCLLLTTVIVLPMAVHRLRRCIPFELRKAVHYLSIVWAISLSLHAPSQRIGMVMGLSLGIYLIDILFGFLMRTHHIKTLHFTRLESAVVVTWKDPSQFVNTVSISYPCCSYALVQEFKICAGTLRLSMFSDFFHDFEDTRDLLESPSNIAGIWIRIHMPAMDQRISMARLLNRQASHGLNACSSTLSRTLTYFSVLVSTLLKLKKCSS